MSQSLSTNIPTDGMPHQQQQHFQRSDASNPLVGSSSPINLGDHGALYSRLRIQVEFYFSPQNLARDAYLRNMLTSNHQEVPSPPPLQLMTPVAVITNFPKVRDICTAFGASVSDPPHVLLARACKESIVVTVSADGAWIGPASQQLPPLIAPTPRMGPPQPQSHFQQSPYSSSPHQRMMMMPVNPMVDIQAMPYMGPQPVTVVQNVPLSQGSASPSSNSLDSMPSQAKEAVVVVTDMPVECNPILLMTAFSTDTIRPKSVSADGSNNIWYISFSSDADAKAAITASSDKTIAGAPIKVKLKAEPSSAKASVASASGASLSSMSATQRQSHMQNVHPTVPQMVQQPVPMRSGAAMYPPGAYPMPQPSPPPPLQPGMPPYPIGPHYNMAPMPMAGIPGQPFPPYPQQMQPMYPYYMPQQGQPPFPMNQPPMMGRYGPVPVPPPPPRYLGPPYHYQHGPQHNMGDGPGQYQGHPPRQHAGEARGPTGNLYEGGQKKFDHSSRKKKNKFQRRESSGSDLEGGSTQQSGNQSFRENASSPNNFSSYGRGRGRHGDNIRRGTGASSPAFSRHQRSSNNYKLSNSLNLSNADEKRDDNKEIFSATDFPGLSGDMKSPGDSQQSGPKNETKIFSGYADALLKKREIDLKTDRDSNATKETEKSEVDSITRQTEAMEREILSDFHDLRVIGNQDHPNPEENVIKNGENEGNSSQKIDEFSKPFDQLPILPGMSDIGQSFSHDIESKSVQSSALHHPSKHSETGVNSQHALPSPVTTPAHNVSDKPASSGAWGSRRLFSDVIKDK